MRYPAGRIEPELVRILENRERRGEKRQLAVRPGLVDFCSNDYLGLAASRTLAERIKQRIVSAPTRNGSTGSRLLSGNTFEAEELERKIAAHHRGEAALLFGSGYDANLGLISAVARRGFAVFYDERCHASIRDGLRLALARSASFRHNQPEDLRKKLARSTAPALVVIESLYSMDGDFAPLAEVAAVTQEFDAALIVDEAHAGGIYGPQGAGLIAAHGLERQVLARVLTFGKAFGVHGAAVVGSRSLVDYLVNFARSFVYSTAPDPHSIAAIESAYEEVAEADSLRSELLDIVEHFRRRAVTFESLKLIDSCSAIQGVLVGDAGEARRLSSRLADSGLDARAILSPTVPKGSERIRICLHAFNTRAEVDALFSVLEAER